MGKTVVWSFKCRNKFIDDEFTIEMLLIIYQ